MMILIGKCVTDQKSDKTEQSKTDSILTRNGKKLSQNSCGYINYGFSLLFVKQSHTMAHVCLSRRLTGMKPLLINAISSTYASLAMKNTARV